MSNVLPDCMMPDGGDPCKGYTDTYEELREARAEIARLTRENESLEATSEQAHHDRNLSWRHIAERDAEIAQLRADKERLKEDRDYLDAEIAKLHALQQYGDERAEQEQKKTRRG